MRQDWTEACHEANEPKPNNFGEFVRKTRSSKGMSLRSMADKWGLSPTYVCGIERGMFPPPTFDHVEKLSAILDVSIDDLMIQSGRYEDMLKRVAKDRPDMIQLFMAVKSLPVEKVEQVTRVALFLADDEVQP